MKRTLLIVFLFALATSVHAQTLPKRTMAVTIDDLPFVAIGEGDYVPRAKTATAKILNALKKHKAPAVGFVNENKFGDGQDRDARIDLLREWVKDGMVLGNHTYSHPDFNQLTVEQFQDEITKGEVVTRQLMKSRRPYQLYFRHPATHTGDTQEKKEAIEKFLAARGYQFVTLDKVMADPAYETKVTYITKYGPTWFMRWSESKGLNVSFRGDPDPPKWVMDLFKNRDNQPAK